MPEVKIAALLIANLLWAHLVLSEALWFAIPCIMAATVVSATLLEILKFNGQRED